MLWVLIALIIALAAVVQIRFGPPRTRRLSPDQKRQLVTQIAELQLCLRASSHVPVNDLIGGLERMKLGGVLIRPGDANALTRGRRTYFSDFFFEGKTDCQQMYTLLWEAMRVAGNYVEVDRPDDYIAANRDVEQAFAAIAHCLGCLHDLPPGLPLDPPPQGSGRS